MKRHGACCRRIVLHRATTARMAKGQKENYLTVLRLLVFAMGIQSDVGASSSLLILFLTLCLPHLQSIKKWDRKGFWAVVVLMPHFAGGGTSARAHSAAMVNSVECVVGMKGVHESTPRGHYALAFAIMFCVTMMCVEGICGIIANSLAILSDAVHMLTDVFTLSISLFAMYASSWGPTQKLTYGWRRAEVVGALCSILSTWALVAWIILGAMDRSVNVIQCAAAPTRIQCEEINAKLMLGVGVFGLCMNIVLAVIMSFGAAHPHSHGMLSSVEFDHDVDYHSRDNHHGHSHLHHEHQHRDGCSHSHGNGGADMQRLECASPESEMMEEVVVETTSSNAESICSHERGSQSMNLRAAVLHVFGDCLQSLGVVLAACVIWAGNNSSVGVPSSAHSYYNLADPLLSVLFGVITVYTTLNLFKEVIVILLEQVPPAVEYTVARDALLSVEKVQAVDDLHIWAVGPGFSVLSAHLCTNGCATTSEANAVVEDAECRCRQLGIVHTTIQLKHAADVRNTGA